MLHEYLGAAFRRAERFPTAVSAALRTDFCRLRFYCRILIIIGATQSERFLTVRNLTNVARQAAFLGIVALGQMLVILTAGIDLSVGSLVKLSILVSAIVMNGETSNQGAAIAATLGLGLLVGLIHGFLVNEVKIAPFIVTLASLGILRGISLSISTSPVGSASRPFIMFYVQRSVPCPVIAIMFGALLVLTALLLRYTAFGKYLVRDRREYRSGASLGRAGQACALRRLRDLQHQRLD